MIDWILSIPAADVATAMRIRARRVEARCVKSTGEQRRRAVAPSDATI
jgi:hypothetical protein